MMMKHASILLDSKLSRQDILLIMSLRNCAAPLQRLSINLIASIKQRFFDFFHVFMTTERSYLISLSRFSHEFTSAYGMRYLLF